MPNRISSPYPMSPDTFLRQLAREISTMNKNEETSEGATAQPAHSATSTSPGSPWATASEEEDDFKIKGCAAKKGDDDANENEKASPTDSDTSTNAYQHEAFETFQHRVATLCQQIWPVRHSLLQRLAATRPGSWLRKKCTWLRKYLPPLERHIFQQHRGGSYNRIVSISIEDRPAKGLLAGPTPEPARHMMLRIPRFTWARPDREVALLDFIRARTSKIPLPEVVDKDFLDTNPLGKPYVIYNRIPGQDLQLKWDDLTHSQKCSVAKDLAHIYKEMLAIRHYEAGTVNDFVPAGGENAGPKIIPMVLQTPHGPEENVSGTDEFKVDDFDEEDNTRYSLRSYHFFREILKRRRATDKLQFGEESNRMEIWDELEELLVEDMRWNGFLDDVGFSLCHLDLQARNIMADVCPISGEAHITGILDWDSGVLAPAFINCTPPWWMWCPTDDWFDEFDETCAKPTPSDPDKAEIKRIFDAECGQTFHRYAYGCEYRLGRILFRLIETGMAYDQQYDNLERLWKRWPKLYEADQNEKFPYPFMGNEGVLKEM